jgi:non-ribosomal peptide synthetase component E (peptide arylation enzyme)
VSLTVSAAFAAATAEHPERDLIVHGHRCDLRTWTAEHLADYKAPDQLVVLDALPTNATGKIDKRALADALDVMED